MKSKPFRPVIPTRAHPLVKLLCRAAADRGMNLKDIHQISGVGRNTIYWWCHRGAAPRLDLFEATLNTVGKRLVIEDME